MKLFIIAIIVHIAYFVCIGTLYALFDWFKGANKNAIDALIWLGATSITTPLYYQSYQCIFNKKWLAIILAIVCFIAVSFIAIIAMLFWHTEVLKSPL